MLRREDVLRIAREAGGRWEQGTQRSAYPVKFNIDTLLRFAAKIEEHINELHQRKVEPVTQPQLEDPPIQCDRAG
jgi:hypothetical protein